MPPCFFVQRAAKRLGAGLSREETHTVRPRKRSGGTKEPSPNNCDKVAAADRTPGGSRTDNRYIHHRTVTASSVALFAYCVRSAAREMKVPSGFCMSNDVEISEVERGVIAGRGSPPGQAAVFPHAVAVLSL
ncbi:hypothetical protein AAFF_G00412680 [Aldrovandia affinis]|uniref:Uncharacterized protein n=1 Tax=Aldrovandia affinis TaxID=143900 RepID=A0AAD7SB11_9TELE|nr:hypothetical protein AAFF_G00412680 [Aldrovandia affinis]